jgi:CRISPR type III-B/RAMP module RAMP protein Cmr6
MLAHYVEEFHPGEKQWRRRVFGDENKLGEVLFFDAFPRPNARLFEADVINKHYPEYYEPENPSKVQAPADYWEPEPVQFLGVAAGVEFVIRCAARDEGLLPNLDQWIVDAFGEYGIGAKTRVNYGRLKISAVST